MTIDELGAWGDFLGGIAVLAGLVFVGVQLLGGNREARAATVQSTLQMQMLLDTELARHAETWNKVIQSLPISDEAEIRRGIILYNLVMTSTENRYHQFKAGYLDQLSWNANLSATRKTVACDIYDEWKTTAGAATHSADFLELVESIAKDVRR
jgi:hypothetical protein